MSRLILSALLAAMSACSACASTTERPSASEAEGRFILLVDSVLQTSPSSLPQAVGAAAFEAGGMGHDGLVEFLDIAERLLYEPSSPWHNEAAMEAAARVGAVSGLLDEYERLRYALIIEDISRNAPGTVAPDIAVTLRDGSLSSLSMLSSRNGVSVIAFYDPECDTCSAVMDEIVRQLGDWEGIGFIAIYPGADEAVWSDQAEKVKAPWIDCLALDDVEESGAYRLPSTPTLFLVDSSSVILMKDPTPAAIAAGLK